ncbi:MAG TPA: hypothetical protein VFZ85_09105 [Jiangellaceae bacterium]
MSTEAMRENTGLRAARLLSAIAVVLIFAAAAAGLFGGIYEDDESVVAMLRGYDLIALVVVTPVLGATLLPSMRTRPRAQLLWVGMLAYCVYNYALYLFGTQYSSVFLLHIAVFTVSVYALVLALAHLDVAGLARLFADRTPVRTVSAILALLGVALGTMWVAAAIRFVATGELPEESSKLVVPFVITRLGHALDLSLLVPAYLLAAVLLWRRKAWGYTLAAMLLAAGAVHQIGYMVALPFQVNADIAGASAFDPLEPVIALAYVIALVLLLANIRDVPRAAQSEPIGAVPSASAAARERAVP